MTTLIGYTSFNDESGESQDRLVTFKRWLWAVIEKMAPLEKQVLSIPHKEAFHQETQII